MFRLFVDVNRFVSIPEAQIIVCQTTTALSSHSLSSTTFAIDDTNTTAAPLRHRFRRPQQCQRCKNHGDFTIRRNRHQCPYCLCRCSLCDKLKRKRRNDNVIASSECVEDESNRTSNEFGTSRRALVGMNGYRNLFLFLVTIFKFI